MFYKLKKILLFAGFLFLVALLVSALKRAFHLDPQTISTAVRYMALTMVVAVLPLRLALKFRRAREVARHHAQIYGSPAALRRRDSVMKDRP